MALFPPAPASLPSSSFGFSAGGKKTQNVAFPPTLHLSLKVNLTFKQEQPQLLHPPLLLPTQGEHGDDRSVQPTDLYNKNGPIFYSLHHKAIGCKTKRP